MLPGRPLPRRQARNFAGGSDRARAVARELARKLPAGSLTEREPLLFLGCPDADLTVFGRAERPTSGTVRFLPPIAVVPLRFLELSTVHPVVLCTVCGLPPPVDQQDGAQTSLSLRRRVQRDLLCRAYAEGLRAVLSRYVPALHDLGRDRPHLTAGGLLIRTSAPFTARVAFTRIDTRAGAADVLLGVQPRGW